MVIIDLPLSISVNALFAGKSRRYRSPAYAAWIDLAGYAINRQKPKRTEGKVSLFLEVAEPKTNRATDLSNFFKSVEDLLVKHRVVEGDSQHYVREIRMAWSSEIEGCRVTISEYQ